MNERKTVHDDIRIHVLKTEASAWDAVDSGEKTAEFRKDDRGFTVGDVLVLYRGTKVEDDVIYQRKRISHIVRGPAFGIPEGYAMLSLVDNNDELLEDIIDSLRCHDEDLRDRRCGLDGFGQHIIDELRKMR